MRKGPTFLAVSLVLEIHARILEEHGGDPGLRDRGLLEAAVAMPRATFGGAYLHDGIPDMAAAYHFHLSQNHPFVDGNKRVAFVAADIFLDLNGMTLEASDGEVVALAEGLAEGDLDKNDVREFYRRKTRG
ncbi:type II toxin-antitoxin system death-on-curing family toxin [bacterium]|nr:type II toxin-antitoxin system death-on-curing family toxin [bacterium]